MHTNQYKKILKNQKGSAMLIAVFFFVFVGIAIVTAVVQPVVRDYQVASDTVTSRLSYFTAESGLEDALYRIKNNMTIGTTETLDLNGATVTTAITDVGTNQKQIVSSSDLNNRDRNITAVVETTDGVSFNYGVQVGTGGITMDNSSSITGNVYSAGDITGSGSNRITGSAIASNKSSLVLDQENNGGTVSTSATFGNANSTQDFGQSFVPATTDDITQISIYIKKVGTPSNLTVRITSNASGKPNTSSLITGTLSASNVTTSYGWVSINFSAGTTVTAGTTYWLVLDGGTNSSNYYIVGGDSAYTNGKVSIGQYGGSSWSDASPSGMDSFFKIYLGGVLSTISGVSVGTASTDKAYAHTVNNTTVTGPLYCQSGTGNNKSCDSSLADPDTQNFPISDAQISEWKDDAVAGGTNSGSISLSGSSTQTIGPKKIVGNVTLSNSAKLIVSGTLWITGNLSVSNTSEIKLSSAYGTSSGVIIVDGTISTQNSAKMNGSGSSGSYIMAITTSTSSNAIDIANSAGAVILVAPYGTANFSNSAGAKEVTAKEIYLQNTASISYESGLANVNFSSGPSGTWGIASWNETQ